MKGLRKTLLILFVLLAFGQCTWAQTQYINQLRLIGDYDDLIGPNIEISQDEGWTLVDYNLNNGTKSDQYIYLLYKTGTVDDPTNHPITDFYIKSTSDKHDHPDVITYNERQYYRITNLVGSGSFLDSYGDLNDGAGGRYIYLYYTTDAWDYPRGITSIAFNDNSYGAVCGNGSTTPQDLNEGAGGDYIYMHYGYTLTTNVINVDDTSSDFQPLNAHSDQPLYFRLADDAVNGYVVTSSTVNVRLGNTAIVDLNGKPLDRLIQSGSGSDGGHVFKVVENSKLIIIDSSIGATGSISSGDANQGGAFYVDAGSELIIYGGTIEYCQADDGGAIYNLGTLTINGGTIQNCTALSGWGRGAIYNGGTMTINNGTIQNNTAYYGGAIYNINGWSVTINGGTIQNNYAMHRSYDDDGIGGGIVNYGNLIINGGNITGNTCDRNGGGIWMTNEGSLFMKGNLVIRDNKMGSAANNVYLPNGKVINVDGSFTDGACIGVTPQTSDNRITHNYSVYNGGVDPARIFSSDNGRFIKLNENEVIQDPSISVMEAYYIDAESNEAFYSNCFPLSHISDETTSVTLNDGWYLVDADKSFTHRIDLNGNVNIILRDGYTLTLNGGIEIGSDDYSLTIYGQSGQSGCLLANNRVGDMNCYGTITINGGMVNIHSAISAKSINLNWTDYSTTTTEFITVAGQYGGTVTLQKSFYDGTSVIPAGVVANIGILEGKTLVPYALYDINFVAIEHGSFTATPNTAHDGTTVTLTGTPETGYPLCSEITVKGVATGVNVPVTRVGTSNDFTFVMPREAVNVTAKFEDKILAEFINYYGETQAVPATVITGDGNLTLSNGWYVVNNDVASTTSNLKNITINGNNVNFILCDYRKLDLNDGSNSYVTFTNNNDQLIVWGQNYGSGLLRVANTSNIIPVGHATLSCRIVVNGGRVETYDSNGNIGGTNAKIILRGGKITAKGYEGTIRFKRFYTDPNGIKYSGEKTSGFSDLSNKLLSPCDKVFVKEGDWNVAANWLDNYMPGSNDYVTLRKGVTIPNGCLAQMKDIMVAVGSSITIEDGGQFYVDTDRSLDLQVTVEKNISAANGTDQTNWYLISPPVYYGRFTGNAYPYYQTIIALVDGLTEGEYDMYRYYESQHKWLNKKPHGAAGFFDMERGQGYLYRNKYDQTISFTGTMSMGTLDTDNYRLSYTQLAEGYEALQGFNLVGNPYTHNINKGADAAIPNTYLETGFYKLADYGQWVACTDDNTVIGVGEAILVQAKSTANGQCLAFEDRLASSTKAGSNTNNIMFTVANSQYSDVTYAVFEEGHGLTKINHRNDEIPMIYIPKNGENLAIATMSGNTKMFPLNFKAMTMGSYTISCIPEGDFNYLHLVDKITGKDVDLLLEREYSFIGAPSDNDDRFVVYLESSENSGGSDVFAYQNGSEIIVNGEGTLQVFDVMGRMVATQNINGVGSMCASSLPTGVYIFRMNGKTQKIVVR